MEKKHLHHLFLRHHLASHHPVPQAGADYTETGHDSAPPAAAGPRYPYTWRDRETMAGTETHWSLHTHITNKINKGRGTLQF